MAALRFLSAAVILLACIGDASLAKPGEKIRVSYADGLTGGTPLTTGVVRCDISKIWDDGELCRRLRVLKDEDIARCIDVVSGTHEVLEIRLGVDSPKQTTFSEVATAIARLRRLAEENVREGCPVEIKVFPIVLPDTPPAGPEEIPGRD